MYKAAVFDLDGTILDTLADLTAAVNAALEKNGFAPRTEEEVCSFVGNGARVLTIRAAGKPLDDGQIDEMLRDFKEYYGLHCADRTRPYAGIPALLGSLRERGVKTAVVSNKTDPAVQALCKRFFPGMFDFVTGERDGIARKPSTDGIDAALCALGVKQGDAVYIGDSDVDILTAHNAGLPCISVTWGFRDGEFLVAHNAERLVRTVSELERALLGE